MGRRKIEIQPILHERNRAVTFLKRKNGLFKKAYELGVLCSVDVAVIIFEERPGHHLKLYQYCSTDIQDMVQRHLRYEGEKDTRGPADFSGNAAKQLDDAGDGDEDDQDDDDGDSAIRGAHKRRGDGRMKQPPPLTVGGGPEMGYSRIAVPTMSMPGLQPPGTSSGLPISRDREIMHGGAPTMGQNKRPRVEPPGHSRSSSDDPTSGPGGSGGAAYFSSSSSSYRHQQPYHAGSVNHQYGSYFVGSQTSPPPSFIPLQQEYSARGTTSSPAAAGSGGPAATGGGAGGGGGTGGGHYGPTRQQQYDPSLYSPSMIRHPHQAQQHSNGPGGGGSDIYPGVFQLDADGGQRQAVTQNQPFGIEWPIHSSNSAAAAAAAANAATAPSGPASSVSTASSAAPSSAGGDSNWLDFLSGNNANTGAGGAGGGGGAGEPPRSSMSWERGHEVEIFSAPTGAGSGSGGGGSGGSGAGEPRPGSGRGGTSTSPMLSTGKRGRDGHSGGGGGGEADDGSAQGASGHHPSSKMKKVTPTIPVMLQEANANHDSNSKVLPPHLFSRGGAGGSKRIV